MPKENKHRGSNSNHTHYRRYGRARGEHYTLRADVETCGNTRLMKHRGAKEELEDITCYIYNTPYKQLPR